MTDIEQLKALLTTWGVPFEECPTRKCNHITVFSPEGEEGGRPVDGYSGFSVEFTFRSGGTFDHMGIWE